MKCLLIDDHALIRDALGAVLVDAAGEGDPMSVVEAASSQAAGEVLVDCYAQEVRNISAIRVAIVDPGATRTEMRARAYPGEDPATVKLPDVVAARILGILGEQFASPHRERVNQSS